MTAERLRAWDADRAVSVTDRVLGLMGHRSGRLAAIDEWLREPPDPLPDWVVLETKTSSAA